MYIAVVVGCDVLTFVPNFELGDTTVMEWGNCSMHLWLQFDLHYYRPPTKLLESNVFTGVCHSVHRGVCNVTSCPWSHGPSWGEWGWVCVVCYMVRLGEGVCYTLHGPSPIPWGRGCGSLHGPSLGGGYGQTPLEADTPPEADNPDKKWHFVPLCNDWDLVATTETGGAHPTGMHTYK